jgi:hypothetical protein
MKKILILFAMGLLIACSSTRITPKFLNNRKLTSLYKIIQIKNEESFYLIYAVRNDSTFKIISNVDVSSNNVFDCEKVKIDSSYILDLKVVFPDDSLFGKPVAPNLGIRGFRVNNGKTVMLETKSHNKIYKALNLNGLCVQK